MKGRYSRSVQAVSLLAIGLGIGWLTGLAASPVVGSVIATLVGIGAGLITALQTIRPRTPSGEETIIDPVPAALVVIGLALAAPVGILARSHRIFEPKSSVSTSDLAYRGVLFGNRIANCDKLAALAAAGEKEAFVGEFRNASPKTAAIAGKSQDFETLRLVVEALCETE